MRQLIKRFYDHDAKGLFHQGQFSIANWFGDIEFQISQGNAPIVCVRIIDNKAVIEKLSDRADRYIELVREIVSQHHQLA